MMAYSCPPGGWDDAGDALAKCGLSSIVSNHTSAGEQCRAGQELEYSDPPPSDITAQYLCPFNSTVIPTWEVGLKITVYTIAILMATVGNIAVLLTIFFSNRLHASTGFYLAQLALADLMVSVFNMGVHLGMSINQDWPFSSIVCRLFPFFQSEYYEDYFLVLSICFWQW